MASFDVVVCGSLHLDIVVTAPALPRIDETAVGSKWQKACGGKGGNQAVRATESGARTAMIGRIGSDEFGVALHDNLKASGVDVSAVIVDPAQGSGMSVAILQDNGDYGAVIVSGANLKIDATRLHDQWNDIGGAKVLVLQNEIPHDANVAVARAAHADGALVVLNAAPVRAMGADLAALVDVLVVNRVEAEAMSGLPVHDRASARKAVPALSQSARSVIITLGGEGLVVAEGIQDIHDILPVPVTVTSTHGAGDCFVGVLAAQLASGKPLKEACHIANTHAAAFVSRPK